MGGRVLYNRMNVRRQRACMEELLCQICGGPAGRDRNGWLFLDWRRPDSPPTWPERSITSMPPLCAEHARVSVRQCPFLGTVDYAVLRVRKPCLHGVSGTLYRLTDTGWRTSENDVLSPYGEPRLPGMLASRLHRELRGVTVVDLPQPGPDRTGPGQFGDALVALTAVPGGPVIRPPRSPTHAWGVTDPLRGLLVGRVLREVRRVHGDADRRVGEE
ncbi:hypothetical protein [Streptomyces sp. NPDC052042]|uniref:hypothetical protein n=1 Tax=Streptomyces sp. NPDC052042 TaxID=3365683 RepID=UPI0037D76698